MTDERCDLICIDAPRAESIRERLLDDEAAQNAAERARTLSDPTRLTLAAALREGDPRPSTPPSRFSPPRS